MTAYCDGLCLKVKYLDCAHYYVIDDWSEASFGTMTACLSVRTQVLIFILIGLLYVLFSVFVAKKTTPASMITINLMNTNEIIDNMVSNVVVLKNNSIYRIGDVLYCKGNKWKSDIEEIKENKNNEWESTLLYKYFNLANETIIYDSRYFFDKQLLNKIINEYVAFNIKDMILPSNDELVIYIRCGDTMIDEIRDPNHKNNTDFWYSSHLKLIDAINVVLNQTNIYNPDHKLNKINQITFVTALHFGNYIENNDKFMYNKIKEQVNKNVLRKLLQNIYKSFPNLSFKLISNKDIDRDLIYLSKAKYLILDYSGFAEVVSELNDDCYICLCLTQTRKCKNKILDKG